MIPKLSYLRLRGFLATNRRAFTLRKTRGEKCRFYQTKQLFAFLHGLPEKAFGLMKYSFLFRDTSNIIFIYQIAVDGTANGWIDKSIPTYLYGSNGEESLRTGLFFKANLSTEQVQQIRHFDELTTVLSDQGFDVDKLNNSKLKGESTDGISCPWIVLVSDNTNCPHILWLTKDETVWHWKIVTSDTLEEAARIPANQMDINTKKIGIVGVGSVGSKVAAILARMGGKNFYLVDHDIFLEDNICRNALDWGDIGDHKVEAVKRLLERINADVLVDVSKIHLAAQESASAIDSVLTKLGQCDIIIDCTADAVAFNILAHVATSERKPMVWTEVFAGGKGGLIARSHPEHDASPFTIRAAYNAYTQEHPAPVETAKSDYTSVDEQGGVMAASDADVTVVASHAARFVVDTLLNLLGYPYSLYLIGLSHWWIFDQPFQTIPIQTPGPQQDVEAEEKDAYADEIQLLAQLIQKQNATHSST